MNAPSSGPPWTLKGLGAQGPYPPLEKELRLFGQFVGDWAGEATFVQDDGREVPGGRGEVHFNWILGGMAVQDVWMYEDPNLKKMVPGGTTLRFYDPDQAAWQSTWISPPQKTTMTFTGRAVNGEIVLEARNRRGERERWIFSGITRDSFHWRAEVSTDEGKTWKINAKYRMKKMSPG